MNARNHEELLLSVSTRSASVYRGHCTGLVQQWPAQKLGLNIEHGSERQNHDFGIWANLLECKDIFRALGTLVLEAGWGAPCPPI